MALLDDVGRIASDESARAEVNPMLESLGLRIGLTFGEGVKGKKRVVRRLLGGVMAFGGTPLPVRMHGAANAEFGPAEPDGSIARPRLRGAGNDRRPRRFGARPGSRRIVYRATLAGWCRDGRARGSCPRAGLPGGTIAHTARHKVDPGAFR